MPVIAQIMIPMRIDESGLIELLKEQVNQCGCLDLVTQSEKLNTPMSHLLNVMRSIDGVVCNDAGMCCATDVQSFADKLKKFQGDA